MTEELEKKLNELLGLKKQLEEATEEKQKIVTASVLEKYKKKARWNLIAFVTKALLGWALILFGLICLQYTPDVLCISSQTIIISGIVIMILAKQSFRIASSKLAILQEMKQFELRITEMLKK